MIFFFGKIWQVFDLKILTSTYWKDFYECNDPHLLYFENIK
jgi:hypothetical protein